MTPSVGGHPLQPAQCTPSDDPMVSGTRPPAADTSHSGARAHCASCGAVLRGGRRHSRGACRAHKAKVKTVVRDLALDPVLVQYMRAEDAQLLLDCWEQDVRPRLLDRVAGR
jgi:hypothetical protein